MSSLPNGLSHRPDHDHTVVESTTLSLQNATTESDIRDALAALHAREIYLQAGRSHAMPPGNVTAMTSQERALITAWFETAAEGS